MQETGITPFRALVDNYLSDELLRNHDGGCPVAALCAEIPRQAPAVRRASTARVRSLVRCVAGALPATAAAGEAGVVAATLVGSLQIARAIGTIDEGKAILAAARRDLLDRYDRP